MWYYITDTALSLLGFACVLVVILLIWAGYLAIKVYTGKDAIDM